MPNPLSLRYACEYDTSGYAVAARRCIRALQSAGVDVGWQPLVDLPGGRRPVPLPADAPADLAALYEEGSADLAVVHSVPLAWWEVRERLQPRRLVGHTVWEADRLPSRWRSEMDVVDEFWVPTEWNRVVFEETFRRPVHVVPHAVASERPEPPPVRLWDGWFTVAVVSAWDWRKRPDLAIEAFLRAFDKDDPVTLVVKAPTWPVAWPTRQHLPTAAHVWEVLNRYPERPRVLLDTADWPAAQVLGLLEKADVFLSTTSSEGWGLGAFDAACLGTPVVVPGFGGQVEWLGADYPGLLPHTSAEAVHPDSTLFEPGMRWGQVDLDDAVDALRALYARTASRHVEAAAALAPVLRERYSVEAVGRTARAALQGASG